MKSAILFFLLAFAVCANAQSFEKKITIPPPKEGESRYFYIPFDVPKDAKSLSVTYEYDKKNGANVLDLGIFDANSDGTENNVKGFRGWSGGRRNTIFISENSASNGYIAGKIPSGTWRVILGLYKIVPEGVEVSVKIRINEIDAEANKLRDEELAKTFNFPTKPRVEAAKSDGFTWFRGDLHSHSFQSDGNWTLKGILDYAVSNNLDFISVTEHNTFSHHAELNSLMKNYPNLLVLRGEEVTTYGGHFNVWGLPTNELIDFRVTPKDAARQQKVVESVHKLGLLASINHPTAICGGCSWTYGDWKNMDSVEIWNGSWDFQDEAALKKWDELLQNGEKITAIGSSDSHTPPSEPNDYGTNLAIGAPTNHLGMKSLTQTEFLSAFKAGRNWISNAPTPYLLTFSAKFKNKTFSIGDTISANKNDVVQFGFAAQNFPESATVSLITNTSFENPDDAKRFQKIPVNSVRAPLGFPFKITRNAYFRIEVRDEKGAMFALTNPIYVTANR